jgi:hypothetical protein
LIGLNDLAEALPELADRDALARCARWLAAQQEADGSFRRHAYHDVPHAYYSRVGAALLTAGRILGDDSLRAGGSRNLEWTLAQQAANGFFRQLSFDAGPPYLHTMIYVAEGLLAGHGETKDPALLAALRRYAGQLLELSRGRDGVLRSQYREDFTVANAQLCLTGLAQWAGLCFGLAALGHDSYGAEGRRMIALLKRQQSFSRDPRLQGGLFGSAPLWGRYMRLAIPNWGVKFFIDALLLSDEA